MTAEGLYITRIIHDGVEVYSSEIAYDEKGYVQHTNHNVNPDATREVFHFAFSAALTSMLQVLALYDPIMSEFVKQLLVYALKTAENVLEE